MLSESYHDKPCRQVWRRKDIGMRTGDGDAGAVRTFPNLASSWSFLEHGIIESIVLEFGMVLLNIGFKNEIGL